MIVVFSIGFTTDPGVDVVVVVVLVPHKEAARSMFNAVLVSGPTRLASDIPRALRYRVTDWTVSGPKLPVEAAIEKFSLPRSCCNEVTAAPLIPMDISVSNAL